MGKFKIAEVQLSDIKLVKKMLILCSRIRLMP